MLFRSDAVKCAGLGLADVWCVVVDLEFDADSTARLMRLVLGALEMRVL